MPNNTTSVSVWSPPTRSELATHGRNMAITGGMALVAKGLLNLAGNGWKAAFGDDEAREKTKDKLKRIKDASVLFSDPSTRGNFASSKLSKKEAEQVRKNIELVLESATERELSALEKLADAMKATEEASSQPEIDALEQLSKKLDTVINDQADIKETIDRQQRLFDAHGARGVEDGEPEVGVIDSAIQTLEEAGITPAAWREIQKSKAAKEAVEK